MCYCIVFVYRMFVVVVFEDTIETVELIPSTWLKSKTAAYWPPYKSTTTFSKAVRTRVEPDAETWKLYKIRVICACGKIRYVSFI